MKVKIKKLVDNAKIPTQMHEGDFCYDVYATSCEEIEPGIWKYGIGLAYEIVRTDIALGEWYEKPLLTGIGNGFHNKFVADKKYFSNVKLSLDFRPRSSVYQTGLILSNCEGTLDEFYRGEIVAYFYEVIPNKKKYEVGDRIGQIKLGITLPIEWVITNEIIDNTERGANGFGSTGLK